MYTVGLRIISIFYNSCMNELLHERVDPLHDGVHDTRCGLLETS
jgi:hypothetical protein